ncbi:MAG: pilus assembly protein [Alphaproteobacteria bacterium]|nr:pilus assembly protein [Alphaproteobacteria bacterium]
MPYKFIKRWGRDKKGTTAVEFSLLVIPYLVLTLAIIELSIMYAAASLLEGATSSAARMIRTGQLQQNESMAPEDQFRDALCSYATVLIDCSDIVIEVETMESFSDFDEMAPTFDEDGNMVSSGVSAGGSNDRVLIRTAVRYTLMTPFIGTLLAGADSSILFMSTIVLQTEPYEFEDIED